MLTDNVGNEVVLWSCVVWRPLNLSPFIIIVQIIFLVVWDHFVYLSHTENRVLLKPVPGGGGGGGRGWPMLHI